PPSSCEQGMRIVDCVLAPFYGYIHSVFLLHHPQHACTAGQAHERIAVGKKDIQTSWEGMGAAPGPERLGQWQMHDAITENAWALPGRGLAAIQIVQLHQYGARQIGISISTWIELGEVSGLSGIKQCEAGLLGI